MIQCQWILKLDIGDNDHLLLSASSSLNGNIQGMAPQNNGVVDNLFTPKIFAQHPCWDCVPFRGFQMGVLFDPADTRKPRPLGQG